MEVSHLWRGLGSTAGFVLYGQPYQPGLEATKTLFRMEQPFQLISHAIDAALSSGICLSNGLNTQHRSKSGSDLYRLNMIMIMIMIYNGKK